jgi:hypothetical protein
MPQFCWDHETHQLKRKEDIVGQKKNSSQKMMQVLTSPVRLKWSVIQRHFVTIVSFILSKLMLIGGVGWYAIDFMNCSSYLLELGTDCEKVATAQTNNVCGVVSSGFGAYGVILAFVIAYLIIDLIMGCTMILEEEELDQNAEFQASYWLEPLEFYDGSPVFDTDGNPIIKVLHNGILTGYYKPLDREKPVHVTNPKHKKYA